MRHLSFGGLAFALTMALVGPSAGAQTSRPQMIPAWIASTSLPPAKPRAGEFDKYDSQTVRQDIRVQTATTRIRLRLTNELGASTIRIGQVAIHRIAPDGSLSSPVLARFDGAPGTVIEPGAVLYTDLTPLAVPAFGEIAVGISYEGPADAVAHRFPVRVAAGNAMPGKGVVAARGAAIVSAVETVATPGRCRRVIVAFGDSITEGAGSTANNDWPSQFARRLNASTKCQAVIVNAGIGGNRVLGTGGSPSALARFDRDVLAVPGVTDIIFLEGINDVRLFERDGVPAAEGAARLIAGYRQIVARAHAHGIRVIGGTLVPYKGTGNQTESGLKTVDTINDTIRRGEIFDAVVDFGRAMADPSDPQRMKAALQKGDWLHPNDAGYAAMAATVPLLLFVPK